MLARPLVPLIVLALAASGCLSAGTTLKDPTPDAAAAPPTAIKPYVVVATLDTGGNPFHPAFKRDQWTHPSAFILGYPAGAPAINLTWKPKFTDSVNASIPALEAVYQQKNWPAWVPGTNIIGVWAHPTDRVPFFDIENGRRGIPGGHYHGAPASSQIAGKDPYSIAPEVWLVIMDRTNQGGSGVSVQKANADGLRWAADQPWIDIIHTNIHNPVPLAHGLGDTNPQDAYPEAVKYAVSKGKLVVSAGGNFFAESTETSPHAGPLGVLAAGANDNCGYADFSNPNPHVVMDGYQTLAAAASGYGNTTFGGTSSASPRTTGYAAKLLYEIRLAFGYTDGFKDGALVSLPADAVKPSSGPLADGRLTALELHEVIRKTANPNPHASKFDGGQASVGCIPQPAPLPVAFYPKMGYGEVSEHTIGAAIEVALGKKPMPSRPAEDAYYLASHQLRTVAWTRS